MVLWRSPAMALASVSGDSPSSSSDAEGNIIWAIRQFSARNVECSAASRSEDDLLAGRRQEEPKASGFGVAAIPKTVDAKDEIEFSGDQIGVAVVHPVEPDQTSLVQARCCRPGALDLRSTARSLRPGCAGMFERSFLRRDADQDLLDRIKVIPVGQLASYVNRCWPAHSHYYRGSPAHGCDRTIPIQPRSLSAAGRPTRWLFRITVPDATTADGRLPDYASSSSSGGGTHSTGRLDQCSSLCGVDPSIAPRRGLSP